MQGARLRCAGEHVPSREHFERSTYGHPVGPGPSPNSARMIRFHTVPEYFAV